MRGRFFDVPLPVFLVMALAVVGGLLWGGMLYLEREAALHVDAHVTFFDAAPRLRAWNDFGWRQGTPKVRVQEGDSIMAASSGRTTVSIAETSSLRLAPGTHIQVMHLRKSKTVTHAHIRLCRGRLWLEQASAVEYVVRSDAGDIECQGDAVEIEVGAEDTRIRTWKGKARYVGALSTPSRQVRPARQFIIPLGRAMTETLLPLQDDWTAWNLTVLAQDVAAGTLPAVLTTRERRALTVAREAQPAPSAPAPPAASSTSPADTQSVTNVALSPLSTSRAGRVPPAQASGPAGGTRPVTAPPPPVAASTNQSGGGTPGTVAMNKSSGSKREYQTHSTWQAPHWLTRKGSPNLTYRSEMSLTRIDTYSQRSVDDAYQRVSSLLAQRFNMALRKPVSIQVVASDDYRNLRTTYCYTEMMKCETDGNRHTVYLIGGTSIDQCYACLGHLHAYAWYTENARTRTTSDSDRSAFCLWIQYKTLAELGALREAQAMTSKNAIIYNSGNATEAMAQMMALERDYGEYGVFHTIIHGHPQDL